MSQRSQRKEEHLALAKMFFDKKENTDFSKVHLLRPALSEGHFDSRSIETSLFSKTISAPFYINAMTGGSKKSYEINKKLGRAAAKENIPMAVGSTSILVKEPDQLKTFLVAREENPDGLFFANVNPATPAEQAKKIVEILQADALQIHINAVQEAVMPEGDRDFRWINNIKKIREIVPCPVIIKEVGQGIDPISLRYLLSEDFEYIDLGGSGGTNFIDIENERRPHQELDFLNELNLSTVKSLIGAQSVTGKKTLFASGGIHNSMEIFKSLVLGAKFVGLARHFLKFAMSDDENAVEKEIQKLKQELVMLFALFGLEDVSHAGAVKYYLDDDLLSFKHQIKHIYQ